MGLLDRLLRRGTDHADRAGAPPSSTGPAGFAVLDLETTGLSPQRDRVVEVAVVHVDPDGALGEHWSTLVHPGGRSVGATRVHGITPADVRDAPRFEDVAATLVGLLAGRLLVAHNAAFDLPFLRVELARAGVAMPPAPHLCTLRESWRHLPGLRRRRLADCCGAAGVLQDGAHAALADATATAHLLAWYLRSPASDAAETTRLLRAASQVAWPRTATPDGARLPRPRTVPDTASGAVAGEVRAAAPGRLAALLAALPLDSPDLPLPEAAGHFEVLAAAMADGVLTDVEIDALAGAATSAGLTRSQVHDVTAVLDDAAAERTARMAHHLAPLPAGWSLGEPLRLGDTMVFTGGDDAVRARLERRTREAGLRVVSTVSGRTAVLVTEDVTSGTGKARRALELGTRVVDAATCAQLLEHVQPPLADVVLPGDRPARRPAEASTTPSSEHVVDLRAADVREWARAQGLQVGDRGRLPRKVLEAYAQRSGARTR